MATTVNPAPNPAPDPAAKPRAAAVVPRLLKRYREEVVPRLATRLSEPNRLALPRLLKVTVSMGVGNAIENKKLVESAAQNLATIAGQRAVITLARRSVASWKLREGMPIGAKVTLRGVRAYEFLDRLISVVIPRIRDFRGCPAKLDGRGNYSLGISELTVFPELDVDKIEGLSGLNVTLTFSGGSDTASRALLEEFGFPFVREEVVTRG